MTEDPSRVKKQNNYNDYNQYPNNQYGGVGGGGYNQYNQYPNSQLDGNLNNPYPNSIGIGGSGYNWNANNNFNAPYLNSQNQWPNNNDYNSNQNGIQRPTYPPDKHQDYGKTVAIYPSNWQKDYPYGQSVNYYARGGCGKLKTINQIYLFKFYLIHFNSSFVSVSQ